MKFFIFEPNLKDDTISTKKRQRACVLSIVFVAKKLQFVTSILLLYFVGFSSAEGSPIVLGIKFRWLLRV